jgi:hypothetical protein
VNGKNGYIGNRYDKKERFEAEKQTSRSAKIALAIPIAFVKRNAI